MTRNVRILLVLCGGILLVLAAHAAGLFRLTSPYYLAYLMTDPGDTAEVWGCEKGDCILSRYRPPSDLDSLVGRLTLFEFHSSEWMAVTVNHSTARVTKVMYSTVNKLYLKRWLLPSWLDDKLGPFFDQPIWQDNYDASKGSDWNDPP